MIKQLNKVILITNQNYFLAAFHPLWYLLLSIITLPMFLNILLDLTLRITGVLLLPKVGGFWSYILFYFCKGKCFSGKLFLTSLHRRPYKHAISFLEWPIGERLNAHSDFGVFWREPCQHATHAVPLWRLTCIHAIISRSPWVHGSVAPDKRHCQQWTSLLFCGFLPNPFIQHLFLWRTSREFVKTNLYPLSLISLRYAVCLTGCWLIIGRCVGACQRSNCAEERWP